MLLDPLVFRNGVRARNRAWLAPMTTQQNQGDGSVSDDEARWFEMRARGGFGIAETGAANVSLDGQAWPHELGIHDDRLQPGLRRLASTIAAAGALGIVQIFHGGAHAASRCTGQRPWSASAVHVPGAEDPREASDADLTRVVGQFRDAAVRARDAGFHGVELHAAHGFLFTQFLSATLNQRRDAWGGTFAGRARLLREALRAVRAAVPAAFLVGVRISPEDHANAVGLDLDESLQLARWLCEDGVDFLHLSLWDCTKNTRKRPDRHPLSLFHAAVARDVALVAAGGVWTRQDAEKLLERGASAVALARAAIACPDWASRVADEAWSPQRPPFTEAELRERGLSARFIEFVRRWEGFVAD